MNRMAPLLASFLAAPPAAALEYECPPLSRECVEPGRTIQESLSAQVTDVGLQALGNAAIVILPELLDEVASDLPDEIDLAGLATIRNLKLAILPTGLQLLPQPNPGRAQIRAVITADLNANSTQERYDISGLLLCGFSGGGQGWLEATANITADVEIQFRAGAKPAIDVKLPSQFLDITNFQANGACSGATNFLGGLVGGLQAVIRPLLVTEIREALSGLEDALEALLISEEIELLGKTLRVNLAPQRSYSTNRGIDLQFQGSFDADPDLCIADVDPGGSFATPTPPIRVDDNRSGTQVAARVADDFLNAAGYAAFRGGLLCITVDDELLGDTSLPIPIDSTLVPLITGSFADEYRKILPPEREAKDLVIQTRPRTVPRVVIDGTDDVNIRVQDLEVGFYTELEGRVARAVALGVDADVGANLFFDDQTGNLEIDVDLNRNLQLDVKAIPDILVAGAGPEIEAGVNNLLNTLLPTLLGDTLDDLAFTLPAFEGVGLTGLQVSADGPELDWLLIDATVGAVTYGAGGGCDGDGDDGCDGGCDDGCSAGAISPLGAGLILLTPVFALRRRRRV